MSTEVALTTEQISLIQKTIAKNASPDEMRLFLYRCKSMGLDPLKPGQIHFVKYGTGPGTIVVGIDGFRAKAVRTGKLSGIKRGVLRNDKGECVGAWAEVYRSDWNHPAREEVSLFEYDTGKGPWAKMPETMIKKVAEASALRMAFADDLGGIYTQEEMHQAGDQLPQVKPEQPEEGDGVIEDPYTAGRILRGSHAGKRPSEVDIQKLRDQLNNIDKKLLKEGKVVVDLPKDWLYTYDLIEKYILDFESGMIDNNGDIKGDIE